MIQSSISNTNAPNATTNGNAKNKLHTKTIVPSATQKLLQLCETFPKKDWHVPEVASGFCDVVSIAFVKHVQPLTAYLINLNDIKKMPYNWRDYGCTIR